MTPLAFKLPPLTELTFASASLRDEWKPVFDKGPLTLAMRWIEAVAAGALPTALFMAQPFQIPQLMRQARELGIGVRILGPQEPSLRLLPGTSVGSSPAIAVGPSPALEALCAAMTTGWPGDVLVAAGWRACCAKARVEAGLDDPVWPFVLSAGSTGEAAGRQAVPGPLPWHPLLHRLGLSLLPHTPCSASCSQSSAIASLLRRDEKLDEIFDWPIAWSALHGLAEVLLPVAKLVHETDAFGEKARLEIESDRLPEGTPQGVVAPYRRPKRRPLRETKTFLGGLATAKENPLPPVPGIGVLDALPDVLPERPALLRGVADNWPALSVWTLSYLTEQFRDCEVVLSRGEKRRAALFGDFAQALESGTAEDWYLTDLGFEHVAEMCAHFALPHWLDSWHFLLPPDERPGLRSLYLGGPGSGTSLHVDILHTCAFNTLIFGSKQWFFCPPSSPLSLLGSEPDLFHPAVTDQLRLRGVRIFTHVQQPGETLFVPSGWWHQTGNIETSLSLTGNIVDRRNMDRVREAVEASADHPVLADIGSKLLRAIELGTTEASADQAVTPP